MKLVLLAALIACALATVFARLSRETRAALIHKAKAMFDRAQQFIQNKLARRRQAWRFAFLDGRGELSVAGRIMMAHLSSFCYAFSTTAQGDARVNRDEMLRREGRRQVWIEIMQKLEIEPVAALRAAVAEQDPLAA